MAAVGGEVDRFSPAERAHAALAYHDATKHSRDAAARSRGMHWAEQPDPFREWAGAAVTRLPLPARAPDDVRFDDLHAARRPPARPLTPATLSSFLFHSLALSAEKRAGDARWFLRVNPSSGNLHPTEAYLLMPAQAAVHHYAPARHALETVGVLSGGGGGGGSGSSSIGGSSGSGSGSGVQAGGLAATQFLVVLTSIQWREGWKYGERSFRYCQHDTGHAVAAVAAAAALHGWSAVVQAHTPSAVVDRLCGLAHRQWAQPQEEEFGELVMLVDTAPCTSSPPSLLCTPSDLATLVHPAHTTWHGTPNRLSVGPYRNYWDLPVRMFAVTRRDAPDGGGRGAPAPAPAGSGGGGGGGGVGDGGGGSGRDGACGSGSSGGDGGVLDAEQCALLDAAAREIPAEPPHTALQAHPSGDALAAAVIRARRSAVDMDAATGMRKDHFFGTLCRLLPPFSPHIWYALPHEPRVHLLLFVHRVTGLPEGLYLLPRSPQGERALRASLRADLRLHPVPDAPAGLPLFRLLSGSTRAFIKAASCDQDIASDGAFAVAMLAPVGRAVELGGAHQYRALHWEAGFIGQMLYLEATARKASATGIGCFLDDIIHEALDLRSFKGGGAEFSARSCTWQTVYHFTVGTAVPDPRIQDAPPYGE